MSDVEAVLTIEVAELRRQVARLLRILGEEREDDRSIAGFCRRKGICRATFYLWRKAGRGPRETRIGNRWLITPEAEADWDREYEPQT
jgi:hypothetical protein